MAKGKSIPTEDLMLDITDLEVHGKGIARHQGKVYFVAHALPGERVLAKVQRSRKDFAEATAVQIIQPSPMRQTPPCQHFGLCGGCTWQHLPYDQQLAFKTRFVADAFQRIGHLHYPPFLPTIGAEEKFYYRNKLDFSCSSRRWLSEQEIQSGQTFNRNGIGFHLPGRFEHVLEIEHCRLQPDPSNDIRTAIKNAAFEYGMTFYHPIQQEGFLRSLIIRQSNLGEWMVIILVAFPHEEWQQILTDAITRPFPQVVSVWMATTDSKNDSITDKPLQLCFGKDHLIEKLGHIQLKLGPKSFYQTNSIQTKKLYDAALQLAELKSTDVLFDLYCGIGSIGLYAAQQVQEVIGIEWVEEAVADARENAHLNDIHHATFYAGDMRRIFTREFYDKHPKADLLITDPPRAGMHPDVVKTILDTHVEKVVYISCNPATQARDLEIMQDQYAIVAIQPVDMFPQTSHIENIVLLKKR